MNSKKDILYDFGKNPVNEDNARMNAAESGLDSEHSIMELISNGKDYATEINITLNGDFIESKSPNQHLMKLNSVIVQDNGCGMHHDTVLERFRGSFQNSASHSSADQSGRNGVGVKTCHAYWKNIYVETTTKERIPMEWDCEEQNFDQIDSSYKKLSSLKPGDKDTELRKYNVMIDKTVCDEIWEEVDFLQSGTKITLRNPRDTVIVDVKELIRRASHSIEFLANPKITNNRISINYKNEKNNPTTLEIKPFYQEKTTSFICNITGSSKKDSHINIKEKESKLFPKIEDDTLDDIEFDITITDKEPGQSRHNDFVLSICGSNVYDYPRKSGPSTCVNQILSQGTFSNITGFSSRIFGYIKTNDMHLKAALRHNKSALELQDKYIKKFFDYIIPLFKNLSDVYDDFLSDFSTDQQDQVLLEVQNKLNKIFHSQSHNKPTANPGDPNRPHGENIHDEYQCNNPECTIKHWKVKKGKIPTFCSQFDVERREGCGSRDIERRKLKYNGIIIEQLPYIGNFVPARFEPNENKVYISSYHPIFITSSQGKVAKTTHALRTFQEQALLAISIAQLANAREMEQSHAQNLKKDFENNATKNHNSECFKIWREKSITYDLI